VPYSWYYEPILPGSDEIKGGKKKKEQELQANLKVMQLGMFARQPGMRNKRRAVNFTISFLVIGHQNCFLSYCELRQ